jgi:pentalenic acid synthase
LLLLRHPAQLAALRADPALMPGAVEEILRYVTIDHYGRRRVATADIEVGGQLIKTGEGVVISHNIANRDPRAFPNPDDFDIRRQARHHLAFSFGPHQCLGQPLGRLELEIALDAVLRRMPALRLAAPFEELRFMHNSTLYGVEELPVTWLPETSC